MRVISRKTLRRADQFVTSCEGNFVAPSDDAVTIVVGRTFSLSVYHGAAQNCRRICQTSLSSQLLSLARVPLSSSSSLSSQNDLFVALTNDLNVTLFGIAKDGEIKSGSGSTENYSLVALASRRMKGELHRERDLLDDEEDDSRELEVSSVVLPLSRRQSVEKSSRRSLPNSSSSTTATAATSSTSLAASFVCLFFGGIGEIAAFRLTFSESSRPPSSPRRSASTATIVSSTPSRSSAPQSTTSSASHSRGRRRPLRLGQSSSAFSSRFGFVSTFEDVNAIESLPSSLKEGVVLRAFSSASPPLTAFDGSPIVLLQIMSVGGVRLESFCVVTKPTEAAFTVVFEEGPISFEAVSLSDGSSGFPLLSFSKRDDASRNSERPDETLHFALFHEKGTFWRRCSVFREKGLQSESWEVETDLTVSLPSSSSSSSSSSSIQLDPKESGRTRRLSTAVAGAVVGRDGKAFVVATKEGAILFCSLVKTPNDKKDKQTAVICSSVIVQPSARKRIGSVESWKAIAVSADLTSIFGVTKSGGIEAFAVKGLTEAVKRADRDKEPQLSSFPSTRFTSSGIVGVPVSSQEKSEEDGGCTASAVHEKIASSLFLQKNSSSLGSLLIARSVLEPAIDGEDSSKQPFSGSLSRSSSSSGGAATEALKRASSAAVPFFQRRSSLTLFEQAISTVPLTTEKGLFKGLSKAFSLPKAPVASTTDCSSLFTVLSFSLGSSQLYHCLPSGMEEYALPGFDSDERTLAAGLFDSSVIVQVTPKEVNFIETSSTSSSTAAVERWTPPLEWLEEEEEEEGNEKGRKVGRKGRQDRESERESAQSNRDRLRIATADVEELSRLVAVVIGRRVCLLSFGGERGKRSCSLVWEARTAMEAKCVALSPSFRKIEQENGDGQLFSLDGVAFAVAEWTRPIVTVFAVSKSNGPEKTVKWRINGSETNTFTVEEKFGSVSSTLVFGQSKSERALLVGTSEGYVLSYPLFVETEGEGGRRRKERAVKDAKKGKQGEGREVRWSVRVGSSLVQLFLTGSSDDAVAALSLDEEVAVLQRKKKPVALEKGADEVEAEGESAAFVVSRLQIEFSPEEHDLQTFDKPLSTIIRSGFSLSSPGFVALSFFSLPGMNGISVLAVNEKGDLTVGVLSALPRPSLLPTKALNVGEKVFQLFSRRCSFDDRVRRSETEPTLFRGEGEKEAEDSDDVVFVLSGVGGLSEASIANDEAKEGEAPRSSFSALPLRQNIGGWSITLAGNHRFVFGSGFDDVASGTKGAVTTSLVTSENGDASFQSYLTVWKEVRFRSSSADTTEVMLRPVARANRPDEAFADCLCLPFGRIAAVLGRTVFLYRFEAKTESFGVLEALSAVGLPSLSLPLLPSLSGSFASDKGDLSLSERVRGIVFFRSFPSTENALTSAQKRGEHGSRSQHESSEGVQLKAMGTAFLGEGDSALSAEEEVAFLNSAVTNEREEGEGRRETETQREGEGGAERLTGALAGSLDIEEEERAMMEAELRRERERERDREQDGQQTNSDVGSAAVDGDAAAVIRSTAERTDRAEDNGSINSGSLFGRCLFLESTAAAAAALTVRNGRFVELLSRRSPPLSSSSQPRSLLPSVFVREGDGSTAVVKVPLWKREPLFELQSISAFYCWGSLSRPQFAQLPSESQRVLFVSEDGTVEEVELERSGGVDTIGV